MLSPRTTWVLYLYAHDSIRQKNKGTYDNVQFFVQNGMASACTRDSAWFSRLLSHSSRFMSCILLSCVEEPRACRERCIAVLVWSRDFIQGRSCPRQSNLQERAGIDESPS